MPTKSLNEHKLLGYNPLKLVPISQTPEKALTNPPRHTKAHSLVFMSNIVLKGKTLRRGSFEHVDHKFQ